MIRDDEHFILLTSTLVCALAELCPHLRLEHLAEYATLRVREIIAERRAGADTHQREGER